MTPDRREPASSRPGFASVLAHELRTPLTSIYGAAQLLVDGNASPKVRRQAAETVAISAERLSRTVEDLLVLARWDEPLDYRDGMVLLQRVVPQVVAAEADRHVGVRFVTRVADNLPAVAGGQGAIEHVLRNLIETAARSSPDGGTVTVEAEPGPAGVQVAVEDDGPALSADEAHGLFDFHTQASRNASDASGANLRLAVARRLVAALRGQIAAHPGAPVSVSFSLPLAREEL